MGRRPSTDRWGKNRDPNAFEMEQHADDNIRCRGCGRKIRYSHGDTDYCSTCNKDNIILED